MLNEEEKTFSTFVRHQGYTQCIVVSVIVYTVFLKYGLYI